MNREKKETLIERCSQYYTRRIIALSVLMLLMATTNVVSFSRSEANKFSLGQIWFVVEAPSEVKEGERFSITISATALGDLLFSHQILKDTAIKGGIRVTLWSVDIYGNSRQLQTLDLINSNFLAADSTITRGLTVTAEKAGTQYWISIETAYVCGVLVTERKFDNLYIVFGSRDIEYSPTKVIKVSYGGEYVSVEPGVVGMQDSARFLCTKSVELNQYEIRSLRQQYADLQDQYRNLEDEYRVLWSENSSLKGTISIMFGIIVIILVISVVCFGLFLNEKRKRRMQLKKLLPPPPPP